MDPKSLRSKLRNSKPSQAFHKLTNRLAAKTRAGPAAEAYQPRALTPALGPAWEMNPGLTSLSTSSSTHMSDGAAADTTKPHQASAQPPQPFSVSSGLCSPMSPRKGGAGQSEDVEGAGKSPESMKNHEAHAGASTAAKSPKGNGLVEEKEQEPSDDSASYYSAPAEQVQQDELLAHQLDQDSNPALSTTQPAAKPASKRARLKERLIGGGGGGSVQPSASKMSSGGWKECDELRNYGRQISVRCSKCAGDIYVGDHNVVRHTRDMMMSAQAPQDATSVKNVVHSFMFCQRCNSLTCVGCGEAVDRKAAATDETTSAWTGGKGKKFRVNWHCNKGRLFMIWLFTAGYDYQPPPPPPASHISHRASFAGAGVQRLRGLLTPFPLPGKSTLPGAKNEPPAAPIAAPDVPSPGPLQPSWTLSGTNPSPANTEGEASSTNASGPAAAATQPPTPAPADAGKGKSAHFWASNMGFSGLKGSVGLPAKGTGYGRRDSRTWTPKATKDPKKQEQERTQERYLSCLAVLLPAMSRSGSSFDQNPPRLVELMVRRSPLVPLCVDLLRSHAMDELAARSELYGALCALLAALAAHRATSPMLFRRTKLYPEREQTIRATVHTLDKRSAAAAAATRTGAAVPEYEETTSLRDLIGAFASQCQILLVHSVAHRDEFKSDEDVRMLDVCENMCRLIIVLDERETGLAAANAGEADSGSEATASSSTGADNGISNSAADKKSDGGGSALVISDSGGQSIVSSALNSAEAEERRQGAYKQWWESNSMAEVPYSELIKVFSYDYEALSLSCRRGPFPQGRMRKLIKDHMALRSGLPEGIFVRLCSSRMDVYKVMIVGPRGTPYENGLFEFDVFCGENYPSQPPQVRFRTTGGGRVRFNPNLYDSGLVCLSLLGTWSEGQRWDPGCSTLLQVLVSIQAMVFCEEPYYNEPGHEMVRNHQYSERESARTRELTLEYAMMSWLRGLPAVAACNGAAQKPLISSPVPASSSSAAAAVPASSPALKSLDKMNSLSLDSTGAIPGLNNSNGNSSSNHGIGPTLPAHHHHNLHHRLGLHLMSSAYINSPGVVWEDLVREHFKANAGTILRTAKTWKGSDNGEKIKALARELESLLRGRGFL